MKNERTHVRCYQVHGERLRLAVCALLASACAVFGQEARFVNAQTHVRTAAPGLEKEFRSLVNDQIEPAWIGYAVPIVAGPHHICCYSSEDRHKPAVLRRGQCKLEGHDEGMNFQTRDHDDDVSPGRLLVLFRVADKRVGKIRVFTDDCELDAGGLAVHWLSEVNP